MFSSAGHRFYDNSTILRNQEGDGSPLEFERMRFSEMQLTAKSVNHHPYFGHVNEIKLSEGYTLDLMNWQFLHLTFNIIVV